MRILFPSVDFIIKTMKQIQCTLSGSSHGALSNTAYSVSCLQPGIYNKKHLNQIKCSIRRNIELRKRLFKHENEPLARSLLNRVSEELSAADFEIWQASVACREAEIRWKQVCRSSFVFAEKNDRRKTLSRHQNELWAKSLLNQTSEELPAASFDIWHASVASREAEISSTQVGRSVSRLYV